MAEAAFSEVLNDETIQALRQERGKLQAELDDKLRTYKPEHPVIQDLKARIAGLDQRLKDQIEALLTSTKTDYEIVKGREQSLYSNIQQLKQQSIELSRQTLELEKLRREYDQDKTFLEQMVHAVEGGRPVGQCGHEQHQRRRSPRRCQGRLSGRTCR